MEGLLLGILGIGTAIEVSAVHGKDIRHRQGQDVDSR